MEMRSLWLVLALAIAASIALLFAAACDDNETAPPAVSATSSAPTTASPTPGDPRRTGIAGIDAIIDAALARDLDGLRSRIRYAPIACVAEQLGIGAPPLCRQAEPEGTLIEVLPVAQCEGTFVRPDELRLDAFNESVLGLYGVYRAPPDFFPLGEFVIVFAKNRPGLDEAALELVTDEDEITGIHYGCAQTPENLVDFQRLTDVLVPPPGG